MAAVAPPNVQQAHVAGQNYHANLALAPVPFEVLQLPVGTYGPSYDIFTSALEKPLPLGWCHHRSTMYRKIGKYLIDLGYTRSQYSVWQKVQPAFVVWQDILNLRTIRPRGIFATTLRRLQLFSVPITPLLVLEHDVAIRGNFSPTPIGPSPKALVNGGPVPHVNAFTAFNLGQNPPQGWPGNAFNLPVNVKPTNSSLDPNNWIIP